MLLSDIKPGLHATNTVATPLTGTQASDITATAVQTQLQQIAQTRVRLDGTGSIGTWPISISGNSATATNALNVNGGSVTASSGIFSSVITVRNGSNAYLRLQPGTLTATSYLEFMSSGDIRQGYIGQSISVSPTDTGNIPYVAGTHSFTGTISGSSVQLTGSMTSASATVNGNSTIRSSSPTLIFHHSDGIGSNLVLTPTSFQIQRSNTDDVEDWTAFANGRWPLSINLYESNKLATFGGGADFDGVVIASGNITTTGQFVGKTMSLTAGTSQAMSISTSSSTPIAITLLRTDLSLSSSVTNDTGTRWNFSHRPAFAGNTPLDSANFTTYTPSVSGSGATGTWGINISGSSAYLDSLPSTAYAKSNSPTLTGTTSINSSILGWNNFYQALTFTNSTNSAISGLNMMIGFSIDRNMYFGDIIGNAYRMTLNMSSGNLAIGGNATLGGNVSVTNSRKGLVGLYSATTIQSIFAMGESYQLGATTYDSFAGIGWGYNPNFNGEGNNSQSKTGLNNQALFFSNGLTQTAIGTGIWTLGNILIESPSGAKAKMDVNGSLWTMNAIGAGGTLYFGNTGTKSLAYDGTNYTLSGGSLYTGNVISSGSMTATSFNGTATVANNALNLGGILASYYVRLDIATTFSKPLTIAAGVESYTTYGPNQTANSILKVGSVPSVNNTGVSSVYSNNGNLYIDSTNGSGKTIYLNANSNNTTIFVGSSYYTLLHTGNIGANSPSLIGTGATGTWGINISGSAASAISTSGISVQAIPVTNFANGFASTNPATIGYQFGESGGPRGSHWIIENLRLSDLSPSGKQNIWGYRENANELFSRSIYNGEYGTWTRFVNFDNISEYAPSLSGSGAIGTWNITAASAQAVDWSGISNKPDKLFSFIANENTDANNAIDNSTAYSQSYNAPWSGPLVTFSALDHDLQFSASTGSSALSYRLKNNTLNVFGVWNQVVTNTNISDYTIGRNSSGNVIPETWLQLNGNYGFYSPLNNNAKFYPTDGSKGSWKVGGSKNSFSGFEFTDSGTSLLFANDAKSFGVTNSIGAWLVEWANGTLFMSTTSNGGGILSAVLNDLNYNSWVPSLSGTGATGNWNISITGNAATSDRSLLANSAFNALALGNLPLNIVSNTNSNSVVRTDGDGNIQSKTIYTSSVSDISQRTGKVYVASPLDTAIKYLDIDTFKGHLGLSYKAPYHRGMSTSDKNYWTGVMGYANAYGGANEIFHGGSGFFDIWDGGNYPTGVTRLSGLNIVHSTTNSLGTTGGQAYGLQIAGSYTLPGSIWTRTCNEGTFSSWYQLLTTNTIQNYAPSLIGTGATGTWNINVTGTSASSAACTGNSATATTLTGDEHNWATNRMSAVANFIGWDHYGNNHVIFDASGATAPNDASVSRNDATIPWEPTNPILMGWDGTSTYGVRVDSARIADTVKMITSSYTGGNGWTSLPGGLIIQWGDGVAYPKSTSGGFTMFNIAFPNVAIQVFASAKGIEDEDQGPVVAGIRSISKTWFYASTTHTRSISIAWFAIGY